MELHHKHRIESEKIKDVQSVLRIMESINIPFRGRFTTDISMEECRQYLYCLEEELEIRLHELETDILKEVRDTTLFFEFSPHANVPKDNTNEVYMTKFGLYQYRDHWYLTQNDHLIFIYSDLFIAIDAFYTECQNYIGIREDIGDTEFHEVPLYAEINSAFKYKL